MFGFYIPLSIVFCWVVAFITAIVIGLKFPDVLWAALIGGSVLRIWLGTIFFR